MAGLNWWDQIESQSSSEQSARSRMRRSRGRSSRLTAQAKSATMATHHSNPPSTSGRTEKGAITRAKTGP